MTSTSVPAKASLAVMLGRTVPFGLMHIAPFGVFLTDEPVTAAHWLLCAALYVIRMFFVTAGYHRYFSHRTFKLNRFWQFMLAVGCCTTTQMGVMWWSAHHRLHHRYSDQPEDVHSPKDGFWWSHLGWIFAHRRNAELGPEVKDLQRFPELRWLEKYEKVPPIALGVAIFLIGGWNALLIGFILSTVLLYHGTFLVNSLAHVTGTRRYATTDTSRNSWWIALLTLGEGWHNNHHHYPGTARQGFFWWEIDVTWYTLWVLSKVGIVKDLRGVPESVRKSTQHALAAAAHASSERPVAAVLSTPAIAKPGTSPAV